MKRGEIWHVGLDPTTGREQAGRRFVLILSVDAFNRMGTPIVAPITTGGSFARNAGFAVPLTGCGTETQGVVLCNQLRAVDLQNRGARRIERVPETVLDEVEGRVRAVLGYD